MESYGKSNLLKVQLHAETYMTCLQHALSTKNFEIIGLLIGDYEDGIVKISASVSMRRLDKKKDRVEISSEQLCEAASQAEILTHTLKRPMRVLGWYHSHPNITVFPSHVDLRTQATYQQMDKNFIGLIFSVFTGGKDYNGHDMYLTCFQSRDNNPFEVPFEIIYAPPTSDYNFKAMINLQEILVEEENHMAEIGKGHTELLACIYNDAVRTQSLCHITDIITKPLMQIFIDGIAGNESRLSCLKMQYEKLQEEYKKCL